ncbi:hypothetical protein FOZ62_009145 [Perkinsus olseni]|uniref:Alpha 1,2-mannosyltransferase 2.4.1 n=2 Tax=Perkinsus olseni TaxID=32597 RepID=A0A7J6SD49_PEROL|nr:hypothetical protein FOZ62_009145 [Perkinsus olseni]
MIFSASALSILSLVQAQSSFLNSPLEAATRQVLDAYYFVSRSMPSLQSMCHYSELFYAREVSQSVLAIMGSLEKSAETLDAVFAQLPLGVARELRAMLGNEVDREELLSLLASYQVHRLNERIKRRPCHSTPSNLDAAASLLVPEYAFTDFISRPMRSLVRPSKRCLALRAVGGYTGPRAAGFRDIAGSHAPHIPPEELLERISRRVKLSGVLISLVSGYPNENYTEASRDGYDPPRRVHERSPRGESRHMNIYCDTDGQKTTYCGVVEHYYGLGFSETFYRARTDVHTEVFKYTRSAFASLHYFSPDMLYIDPRLHNCLLLHDMVLHHQGVKVLYLPFDPLSGPTTRKTPDWTTTTGNGNWTQQCSLAALEAELTELGYVLHHVELSIAVFVLKGLLDDRPVTESETLWEMGFYCHPLATFFDPDRRLESAAVLTEDDPRPQRNHLAEFRWRESAGLRMLDGRALCVDGYCECLPPMRGPLCDISDGDTTNMTIHYLTSNSSRHVNDLALALELLWERFNYAFDHTVVIFYDTGLSRTQRGALATASMNRIWFMTQKYSGFDGLVRTTSSEASNDPLSMSLKMAVHPRPLGYRQVCLFESGPVFKHPALRSSRFTMRLDTDQYFPIDASHADPVTAMLAKGTYFLFSQVIHVAGGRVNHLDAVISLYNEAFGHKLRNSAFLEDVMANAKEDGMLMTANHPPYVFDLDFFAGEEYQHWFKFVASFDGFLNLGWLGNGVFTAGVALHAGNKTGVYSIPTAHQEQCMCQRDLLGDSLAHPEEQYGCVALRKEGRKFSYDFHGRGPALWECWRESDIVHSVDRFGLRCDIFDKTEHGIPRWWCQKEDEEFIPVSKVRHFNS